MEQLEGRILLASLFMPETEFVVGSGPTDVATADFNGDGKQDLAVTNYTDNTVSILLGFGDGTFAPAPGSPILVGNGPYGLLSGNFDSDVHPDLAVANSGDGTVSILRGNGDGTFTPVGSPIPVGAGAGWIASGRFNSDPRPDLAVTLSSSNSVAILLATGDDTFAVHSTVSTGGTLPLSLVAGQFTSPDTFTDLAVTNEVSDNLSILRGDGMGNFTSAADSPYPIGPAGTTLDPIGIVSADFEGDGKPNLAIANAADNSVTILVGNSDGSFGPVQRIQDQSLGPIDIVSGDFNEDGKPDLAVANQRGNSVSVLFNNSQTAGIPSFTMAPGSPFPIGVSPRAAASADFNGDGKPDLAVTNAASNSVSILLSTHNEEVWTGLGSDNLWSDPFNWTSDVAPAFGDALTFPDGARTTTTFNDLQPGSTFSQINFSGSSNYAITGNPISLTGGIALASQTGGRDAFGLDITLAGSNGNVPLESTQPGSSLLLSGSVHLNNHALILGGAGAGELSGVIDGAGAVVKQDAGRWQLGGASTYTGPTTIAAGDLAVSNNSGLGSAGDATTVAPGASLIVSGNGSATSAGAVHIADASGNDTLAGTVSLAGPAAFSADPGLAGLTLAGPVQTGGNNLTFTPTAGTVAFGSGGSFQVGINGSGNSELITSGPVALNGATLSLSIDPAFSPPADQPFVLVQSAGAITGLFRDPVSGQLLNDGDTVSRNGQPFRQIHYINAASGGQVTLTRIGAVRNQVDVWTGGGGNDTRWTTGQNWRSGFAPTPGDSLIFPTLAVANATPSNDFAPGTSFSQITFAGSTTYDLTGAAITLTAGIARTSQLPASDQVELNITLGADASFISTESFPQTFLIISGQVNLNGHTLTLDGNGSGVLTGAISGNGSIIKQGSGQWQQLTGTFNGTLSVQQGTLSPGTSAAGGLTAGTASFGSGTTFQVHLAANGNSELIATGTVDLSRTPNLDVILDNRFKPQAGQDFVIVASAGGLTGLFSDATGRILHDGDVVTAADGSTFVIRYEPGSQARGSSRAPGDPAGRVVLCAAPADTSVLLSLPGNSSTFESDLAITVTATVEVCANEAAALGSARADQAVGGPPPSGGRVALYLDSSATALDTESLVNGVATFQLSRLGLGGHTIRAQYFPDDASKYQPSPLTGPVAFTVAPPGNGTGELDAAFTSVGFVQFAVRDDHAVYEHTASGWRAVGLNFIEAISATAGPSGSPVLFATTQGHDLFLFDPTRGLTNTGLRFIQSPSATTDASGNPVLFVVTDAHDLFEYGPAIGLVNPHLGFIDQISATTDAAGNPVVFAITQGHDLFSFGATLGLHNLQSRFLTAITAVQDQSTHQAVLYATTQGHDLFSFGPQGWQNLKLQFIQALSAGTDAAGRPEVYAITQAGDLAKFDAQRAVSILHPPATAMEIRGLAMDHVLARNTGGTVFEYDGTGWMSLGQPGL